MSVSVTQTEELNRNIRLDIAMNYRAQSLPSQVCLSVCNYNKCSVYTEQSWLIVQIYYLDIAKVRPKLSVAICPQMIEHIQIEMNDLSTGFMR